MAFQLFKDGLTLVEWYPKAASTVFANGGLTYMNGTGALIPADSTSGDHFGVVLRDVLSTDPDFATAGAQVPVIVCKQGSEFLVDVGTGVLTTAMVGNRYDLKDDLSIDVTAQAKQVVTVTKFVSATKAVVKVNAMVFNEAVVTT